MRRDDIGQRSETVRRANLSAIARELHTGAGLSRSELGLRTGLTRSAIRRLIGEFVRSDLVSEQRSAPLGTPGRPSPIVRPRPDTAAVLALDVAVDSEAAALVGFGGKILEMVRVDRARGDFAVDETVETLTGLARSLGALPPRREELLGVGLAVVGVVRREDAFVSMAPNLGWRDVPLGARLRRALGTTALLAIGNEADLGALAEVRRGAARSTSDVIFISGEVAVGGGLIVDGRPLSGVAGYGGEVGHMPVNPAGSPCRCGSLGCWETEVGEDALLVRAGYPRGGGRAAVDALIGEAAAGSPVALAALDDVGRWLGSGIALLVNVLNPALVVLGGLFGRIHPFVERTLAEQLDRLALPASRALVRVVPATLGEDAPLLGAAELAFQPFLADPALWLRPRRAMLQLASA